MVPSGDGVLQIEPTDHCNLACRMCAPHAEGWETVHGVPKGYLDFDHYRRILDRLVEDRCRFDHVILQWLGDPSLHPRLEEMVGEAGRRLDTGYVRFDTNGILMTEARMERLLAEKAPGRPLLVVFTIDAATPETYTRVKGRDALPRVRRHVRALLALRRHAPVNVQVQFVVQPGNAHEAEPFLRYWSDALHCHGFGHGHSEILFKRLSVGGGAAGQADADALYDRATERIEARQEEGFSVVRWEARPWQRDDAHTERGACPALWYTPVIRQDGQLQMCCADMRGELVLGDVATQGYRALWDGAKARELRRQHQAGQFHGPCAYCGGINWYSM